ncbi:ATP-grasp ribosomal peptide maturase [Actinoalloteichus sp. GBA129-24]|uniref:ATP-grasp ribosomal peptide maturase n=1 Tax=Actinoalloteichus sp. GBA129-24 TaxID=1612551 RepID=UPI000950518B|nr:ATP-grasp ribosomal peptide maturase [Actinoalloteichus sp. GBA129-24]APU19492.1 ATP-grasp ribosomal peptide maturase [Actinoalloteichus sp. GBA129-24]
MVISREFDVTVDLVLRELDRRRELAFRFDLADFPESLSLDARLVDGRWDGRLRTGGGVCDLDAVRGVWYRKPSRFAPHKGMTDTEQQWAVVESRMGFGGLLAALPCRWINHPHRNAVAGVKPGQLVVAAALGLTVPESLVTNDPNEAREFVAAQPDGAVYKSFHGGTGTESGRMTALYTTPVNAAEITDGVQRAAHLFQARVPKAFEVRVTVVGDRLFAVRIDVDSEIGRQDWRADHAGHTYTVITPPGDVTTRIHELMQHFDLIFGALDFVVTPADEWVFLEINPNGQWGWLHTALGLPIPSALADALTMGDPP